MKYSLRDLFFESLDAHTSFIKCDKCGYMFTLSKLSGFSSITCPNEPSTVRRTFDASKPMPDDYDKDYHSLNFIRAKKYYKFKEGK